jgi:hypothetical protein
MCKDCDGFSRNTAAQSKLVWSALEVRLTTPHRWLKVDLRFGGTLLFGLYFLVVFNINIRVSQTSEVGAKLESPCLTVKYHTLKACIRVDV